MSPDPFLSLFISLATFEVGGADCCGVFGGLFTCDGYGKPDVLLLQTTINVTAKAKGINDWTHREFIGGLQLVFQ